MNKVSSLLTIESVALDLPVSSLKRVFEEAALLIEKRAGLDHQRVFEALNARERLGTTCVGGSIAVPHARMTQAHHMEIAVLRTSKTIDVGAIDSRRARIFFVIIIPDEDPEPYLEVLSELAKMLQDKAFKEKLLAAATPLEVCETIGSWVDRETNPATVSPQPDTAGQPA